MLLDQPRTLIALALIACGDNTCPERSSDSTCLVTRFEGVSVEGQLGFRFGEPLDLDGDGLAEVVAGARYAGTAGAWSADQQIARWTGEYVDGLFGNVTVAVPDLDGDGQGDVIVSEPTVVRVDGPRGIVNAYRLDGTRIWQTVGELSQGFGWYIVRAGDQTGDGIEDLWVGAPSDSSGGHVYLVSGRDGSIALAIDGGTGQFGWHIAPLGDIDGDGRSDLAIGAPGATVNGSFRGQLSVASATGSILYTLTGEFPDHQFGIMATALDDLDDDGVPDLAVSAPGGEVATAPGGSEIQILSGATGERLRLLTSPTDGELYGRTLATLDDLDGDGVRDLAIGAPWFDGKAGRVEVRSARTNRVLVELVGREPDSWLGWHIVRAGAASPGPGFVVSRLHDHEGRGAIEIHEVR